MIDAALIEQNKELRRKVANQKHIAKIVKLQRQYDSLVSRTPETRFSENSSKVTSGKVDFCEKQVIDAHEVQEFMMEEATAKKLAMCSSCVQPGRIRANDLM